MASQVALENNHRRLHPRKLLLLAKLFFQAKEAQTIQKLPFSLTGANYSVSATPGSTGAYQIKDVPAGSYKILPQSTVYWFGVQEIPINVNGGEIIGVDFRMTNVGSISGQVFFEESGNPENALVKVILKGTNYYAPLKDYGYWAYDMMDIPAGSYTVMTQNTSYYRSIPAEIPITVTPGQPISGINFTLKHTGSISGRITFAGAGNADFSKVQLKVSDGSFGTYVVPEVTGTYQIQGVSPGVRGVDFTMN